MKLFLTTIKLEDWKMPTFQTKLELFNAPGYEGFMMILFMNEN